MSKPIDENTYTELLDARDKLCAYCENTENCPKCQVTVLIDDAYNEAVDAGIVEDM